MLARSNKSKMILVIMIWSILLLVTNLVAGMYVNAYAMYANYVSVGFALVIFIELSTYLILKVKKA